MTPKPPRSMPSPPLAKIALPSTAMFVAPLTMFTPFAPLPAMRLDSMVLSKEMETNTPSLPLPRMTCSGVTSHRRARSVRSAAAPLSGYRLSIVLLRSAASR